MNVNVTFSEPIACKTCGTPVRVRYEDRKYAGIAEPNPIPGTEDKNPVHEIHRCRQKQEHEKIQELRGELNQAPQF